VIFIYPSKSSTLMLINCFISPLAAASSAFDFEEERARVSPVGATELGFAAEFLAGAGAGAGAVEVVAAGLLTSVNAIHLSLNSTLIPKESSLSTSWSLSESTFSTSASRASSSFSIDLTSFESCSFSASNLATVSSSS